MAEKSPLDDCMRLAISLCYEAWTIATSDLTVYDFKLYKNKTMKMTKKK